MTRNLRQIALAALFLAGCRTLPNPLLPDVEQDDSASFPEAQEPSPEAPDVVPQDTESDWLQLESGEWLRGTLNRIRAGTVEFESETLDDLSLDLDDVQSIRTREPQAIVTDSEQIVRGAMVLEGDDLWVEGDRTIQLARDDMFASIAVSDGRPVDWSGTLTIGATGRSGNTKQSDLSAYAELQRETAQTLWRTVYNGVLSRVSGTETANNQRLRSSYDVYLTRRLFLTVPSVDFYTDSFQNIDYRAIVGGGLGYKVVDAGKHRLTLSGGPAFQYTRLETAQSGEDEIDETAGAILGTRYRWDVTDDVDFSVDYSITLPVPDTDEYNHNFIARIAVDLINDLTLDVVFVWDRVNEPVAQADGLVPQEDDFRTTVGLGWSF